MQQTNAKRGKGKEYMQKKTKMQKYKYSLNQQQISEHTNLQKQK